MLHILALTFCLVGVVVSDVIHVVDETITTVPPPPRPYAFGYAAGRFPGTIDRTHSEISDGSGTVQGSYSYVDPSHKIRTVDYVADKNGFHPTLNFAPTDTRAVAEAKAKHAVLFDTIAHNHQAGIVAIPRDSAAVAHAKQAHLQRFNNIALGHVVVPIDTVAVQRKTQKHFDLYAQIAEDHARIAAERKAERDEKKRLGLFVEEEEQY